MNADPDVQLTWGHPALRVAVALRDGRPFVAVTGAGRPDPGSGPAAGPPLPPVEIFAAGHGRARAGRQGVESAVGARLVLVGHRTSRHAGVDILRLDLRDPYSGLLAEVEYATPPGVGALRGRVRVVNHGSEPVTLLAVSSLVLGGLPGPGGLTLVRGRGDWLGEGRFGSGPLRAALPALSLAAHGQDAKGGLRVSSAGSWSTGGDLPVGALVGTGPETDAPAWSWQIEHNGAWSWEIGERRDGTYLVAYGPDDRDGQWQQTLAPGESFTTVPAAVAVVGRGGLESAQAVMTTYRRTIRRPHRDDAAPATVFNDYMNTLMGDPTTARLLPLVDAAARTGAETFCIDAGWYAEGPDWWDSVGEWQPSRTRFPNGLDEVLDHIRGRGMAPGLWLEPEVVGVRSPLVDQLPKEAFFQRAGVPVVESDRRHLDLRHPAARAHLDEVVDRIVGDHGVTYLKLDYNIDAGPGSDLDGQSPGAGLLGHNRSHLDWLDGVRERHPDLVVENCASGAMRADYALLSRLQLQSTSDQQDPLRYPPIAAAAPFYLLPEQAANWAYPQPGMSAEEMVFTLCCGLAGRLYLSGHLDRMSGDQLRLVTEAVEVHHGMRADLTRSIPFWPLGLPGWDDQWVVLGLRAPGGHAYLLIWSRPPTGGPPDRGIALPLPDELTGRSAELLFPADSGGWAVTAAADGRTLDVVVACAGPSARLLRLPRPPS